MKTCQRKSRSARKPGLVMFSALICAAVGLTPGTSLEQTIPEDWKVDPIRGPVDMGLTDPSLIGAIDVHLHVDPDAPGTGGVIRAIDVFDAARIAMARGMRGFVFKTQDAGSAAGAYLVRKHLSPTFEIYGRTASNYATGGINVAALEHYTQIKGGWGRIFEMPTRDSITATTRPGSMEPQALAQNRPWMIMMPPETPPYIAVSKNGQLLPEVVKHLIGVMAKIQDGGQQWPHGASDRPRDARGAFAVGPRRACSGSQRAAHPPRRHSLVARNGQARGVRRTDRIGHLQDRGRTKDGGGRDPQDRRRASHRLDGLRADQQRLSHGLPGARRPRAAGGRRDAAGARSDI